MVEKLEAEEGQVEMSFPYFIEKKAPVSGVKSLMDYEVTFVSQIRKGKSQCFRMKVVVPVTSLCPCSKKISERGAHNQRSHVTVAARISKFVWIEEIIDPRDTRRLAVEFARLAGRVLEPGERKFCMRP